MSLQKSRPMTEALQHIMTSFKQFERKLDKLQDDVNNHGHTLKDLRSLVTNLSTGTLANADDKREEIKRIVRKTTAIQYDHPIEEPVIKTKRKTAIQPFPSKMKTRSFQGQGIRMYDNTFRTKINLSPLANPVKYPQKLLRQSKTEPPRKPTTIRTRKSLVNKRSKQQKTHLQL